MKSKRQQVEGGFRLLTIGAIAAGIAGCSIEAGNRILIVGENNVLAGQIVGSLENKRSLVRSIEGEPVFEHGTWGRVHMEGPGDAFLRGFRIPWRWDRVVENWWSEPGRRK